MDRLADLLRVLPDWFAANARDLPWRRDREPYHVWLSEIMLQQTRVEAVKGYYTRFLAAVPDIPSLAAADPELLHKLWEGLGYYSRVRNLQKAAQVIMSEHGGVFPRDLTAIRALPGIGDYTAGAIGSICFDLPTPAVDGNVVRVSARLREDLRCVDDPKVRNEIRQELAACYPEHGAGTLTQALMELGRVHGADALHGPRSALPTGSRNANAVPPRPFALPMETEAGRIIRCGPRNELAARNN